jgi:hypothetical protein
MPTKFYSQEQYTEIRKILLSQAKQKPKRLTQKDFLQNLVQDIEKLMTMGWNLQEISKLFTEQGVDIPVTSFKKVLKPSSKRHKINRERIDFLEG